MYKDIPIQKFKRKSILVFLIWKILNKEIIYNVLMYYFCDNLPIKLFNYHCLYNLNLLPSKYSLQNRFFFT